MYVKITAGEGHGDLIYDAGDQVQSGSAVGRIEDLESDRVNYQDLMGVQLYELHLCEIDPQQTKYEQNEGMFVFRYAWWYNNLDQRIGVATTRNIFVVGNDGKTIDRVR